MDHGYGRSDLSSVRRQARPTEIGRPNSSMRLSVWTATSTSVARRRSARAQVVTDHLLEAAGSRLGPSSLRTAVGFLPGRTLRGRSRGCGTSSVSTRRQKVVWSGPARLSPDKPMTEPTRPPGWRSARRNTILSFSAVKYEYQVFWINKRAWRPVGDSNLLPP